MAEINEFEQAKLIASIVINPENEDIGLVKNRLAEMLGPIDFESKELPCLHAQFYEPEMGSPLSRYIVAFHYFVDVERLTEFKINTIELESELSFAPDRRNVNIDPGFVNLGQVIFASTRNALFRVPVNQGVLYELSLVYREEDWHALPWTNPDFATLEYRDVFSDIRALYWQQKQRRPETPAEQWSH